MRYLANILTAGRVVLSLGLLCFSPFTAPFLTLYVLCGLTDMLDGTVARRTGTVSRFGAGLDSAADLIFVLICLIRLLPVIALPLWLWGWIALIAVVRLVNLISGYVRCGKLVMLHTPANKITGFLLFLLPLCIGAVDIRLAAVPVCAAATFAAVQEGHLIRTR